MTRPSTVLFVPFFNEQGRIGALLERIALVRDLFDELLLVDDGSTDRSLEEVRAGPLACTVLRHRRRSGLGEAFRTAYRDVLNRRRSVFCVLAGNGKDDPLELGRVVGPVQAGLADYVQGSRFHPQGGRSERLPRRRMLAIRAFTLAASAVCGKRFTDCSNGYRAYRTELLEDPRIDWCAPWLGTSYQVEIYLLLAAVRLGYRVVEAPTSKVYPDDGRPTSKAALADWLRICVPLLWTGLRLDRLRSTRRAPGHSPEGWVERLELGSSSPDRS